MNRVTKSSMPFRCVAVGFLLCAWGEPTRASSEILQQAVQVYRQAMDETPRSTRIEAFRQAEALFRQVIQEQTVVGADLYTNLGNAALQAHRIGPAIAAYRQALAQSPSHRRAATNLQHARSLLPDWVRYQDRSSLVQTVFFWSKLISPAALSSVAAFFFLLAAVLVSVSIRLNQPIWRSLAFVPAIIWIVFLISLGVQSFRSEAAQAVVIVEETVARSADSSSSASRFESALPGGTEVTVVETRDDWSQIQLPSEQLAWVRTSTLEFIGKIHILSRH